MAVAGGDLVMAGGGEFKNFEGRTTSYLVFICLLIASCGLMFGYDIGINGGVAEMNSFLEKFFPTVVVNKRREAELREGSLYCQYNNQNLQAYNSALYLAAFVSTWFSSYVTRHYGRKASILVAGISFLMGCSSKGWTNRLFSEGHKLILRSPLMIAHWFSNSKG